MNQQLLKFMERSRDFKARIRRLVIICAFIPLLAIGSVVIWSYSNSSTESLQQRIAIESQIIRDNIAPAVLFSDFSNAKEILSTTKADPSIIRATLLSERKEILAEQFNIHLPSSGKILTIEDSILFNDQIIGYLQLEVSGHELNERLMSITLVLVVSLVVILATTIVFSTPLVNSVLFPLVNLYNTAKNIAQTRDYTQRVTVTTQDEVGRLSDMFNRMIEQIEQRDEMLEKQVSQRTLELEKLAEEFRFRAFHDSLTGLPNRALLNERFQLCLDHANRLGNRFAFVLLDLDDFKTVNDSKGHEFGDELLVEVSKRLRHVVRTDDLVCRLGGDEFVIIINDLDDVEEAKGVVKKILFQLAREFSINGEKVRTAASIGVAFYPDHGESVSDIKRHADVAMYKAKDAGKNQYCLFSDGMQENVKYRLMIQNDLKEGLENQHFEIYVQPKINVTDNTVVSCEALVRWNHPKEGFLTPDKFVPYAEDAGLIHEIDYFVIRACCEKVKDWELILSRPIPIAFNLSGRHFHDFRIVDKLDEYINAFEIDPSLLEVEITEAVLIEDPEKAKKVVQAMKALGLSISLDDFGTGYSSLEYLRTLPIDTVKLDRAFVLSIHTSAQDRRLTRGIVSLTKGLNLQLVAEGVESQTQMETLKELGCHLMQGYHFLKPVPTGKFLQWYIRNYSVPRILQFVKNK